MLGWQEVSLLLLVMARGSLDDEQTPNLPSQFARVVDDHRPGRLVDLENLAEFKIMVDRVGNDNRAIKHGLFVLF